MHPGGTAHLGHPADGFLHLLSGHQHQVCQLVDDHHHRGQGLELLILPGQRIIARQILDPVLGEKLIALHHLEHRPLQGSGGLFGVRHHGDQQVGDAVVGGQLHHFGVHHDEADLLRRGLIEDADDEGIGTHGLTGAGGTGDEHMRKLADIPHDAAAADVLAHGEGHRGLVLGEGTGLHHVPDADGGDGPVRDLDAHHGNFIGDGGDANAAGAQCQRNVIGEVGDLGQLHPLLQRELIAGDAGAVDHGAGVGVHAEALKGLCQALGVTPQLSPHLRIVVGGILIQKRDGGILVCLLRLGQLLLHRSGHLLGGVLHLLRRDGRLGRLTGLSHRGGGSRRCRWGSNGGSGGHGGGFLRRLPPQHLIRGADGAALTGEEGFLLLRGKGGFLRPGLRLFGGRLVIQGDIDGGTAAGPLLRRFLLLTDGGCFLRDVLPLRLPALLRPADGILGGDVQRQTQGRQQHEEEQDQRQHLAEYGGEAHRQTAGQGAAALQGPAGEPQLPQAGEARLIGAGAQQQMQAAAGEHRHQQRTYGAQGGGTVPVGQQQEARQQQGRGRQPVAVAQQPLQQAAEEGDEQGLLLKIGHDGAQGQQQADTAGDLPAVGRGRRGRRAGILFCGLRGFLLFGCSSHADFLSCKRTGVT